MLPWFEWDSSILVSMPIRKVRLCLDPAITPVHSSQTTNDIVPKFTCACYLTLIDTSSGYHNMKLNENSSYLITFVCQFSRYSYTGLPFSAAWVLTCFKENIWHIQRIECFWHCRWHITCMKWWGWHGSWWYNRKIAKICRRENLKLNIDQCHFWLFKHPFLCDIVSHVVYNQTHVNCMYWEMPSLKSKKQLQRI